MKRRKLPGCECPQCGEDAVSRGPRYRNDNGDELSMPQRRFFCGKCKHSFKQPAPDLLATLAGPNPSTPTI